jgi:hypothetical protein
VWRVGGSASLYRYGTFALCGCFPRPLVCRAGPLCLMCAPLALTRSVIQGSTGLARSLRIKTCDQAILIPDLNGCSIKEARRLLDCVTTFSYRRIDAGGPGGRSLRRIRWRQGP